MAREAEESPAARLCPQGQKPGTCSTGFWSKGERKEKQSDNSPSSFL
jgi:hypothetical protein